MNNYLIIGRTNVGKSYFFNLFTKDRKTISIDQPHTTVDIIKQKILLMSREEKYAFMVEEKFLNAKFHVNLR